jgi:hypothetical protein
MSRSVSISTELAVPMKSVFKYRSPAKFASDSEGTFWNAPGSPKRRIKVQVEDIQQIEPIQPIQQTEFQKTQTRFAWVIVCISSLMTIFQRK